MRKKRQLLNDFRFAYDQWPQRAAQVMKHGAAIEEDVIAVAHLQPGSAEQSLDFLTAPIALGHRFDSEAQFCHALQKVAVLLVVEAWFQQSAEMLLQFRHLSVIAFTEE